MACMSLVKSLRNFFKPQTASGHAGNVGRNDLCWCGSGKKYKKCHLTEDEKKLSKQCHTKCRTT